MVSVLKYKQEYERFNAMARLISILAFSNWLSFQYATPSSFKAEALFGSSTKASCASLMAPNTSENQTLSPLDFLSSFFMKEHTMMQRKFV